MIVLEVLLLVAVVLKLGWDCVRYRRTGHLPWVARHMCWSLPGTGRVLTRSAPIVVLQKVPSELHPKVCNHGEGPY